MHRRKQQQQLALTAAIVVPSGRGKSSYWLVGMEMAIFSLSLSPVQPAWIYI